MLADIRGAENIMIRKAAFAVIVLLAIGGAAVAQERLRDGLVGAGAGALVGGPVGAVVGGAAGYVAGPTVTRAVSPRRRIHRRRYTSRRRTNG